ncbi:MAG TPA: D-glycero-beta-D-manno-heptose-7-phosphate kinase [Burkholderiaceae bacterium]|nr:D-glycero-beta-D-manno-heptose-7-phosphate kinase [Burkholderiaceae bacterium]
MRRDGATVALGGADIQLPEFTHARVLVVGDLMLDRYWFGDVNRISPEAPVPVVAVTRTEDRLGGAANVARNAASLNAHVALMGVVGADEPGTRLRALVEQGSITPHLYVDPRLPTTIKLRVVGRTQQLLRIDFETRPSEDILLEKLEDFRRMVGNHDVVVFSDYGKGGLAHIGLMISAAREAGCKVLVDPKGSEYTRYRGAHVVTPNRAELREVVGGWTDEAQLREKALRLRDELGLEALLLTRSEEGMTLFGEGEPVHVPTVAREVYDVSGAGDTVIATLAASLAAKQTIVDAVKLANIAAGIVVGKLGTAVVTREELAESLK